MRKINTRTFKVATRSTPHDINRQIVLNLIREHQPISRAELARRMNVRRAAVTDLVRELLERDEIVEMGTAAAARGRRPTLLRIHTSGRLATAVDVRPTRTTIVLSDFGGTVLERDVFATPARAEDLVRELRVRMKRLLATQQATSGGATCQGIGVVVPGMVDRRGGRVLYAPRLGWRDVDLRDALALDSGVPVFVENAAIACALARLWSVTGDSRAVNNFAYVIISDGVGVAIVLNGEILRGEFHTAGEFGHVSLDPFGPQCACGKRGCWEAFACNSATAMRYLVEVSGGDSTRVNGTKRGPMLGVEEIIRRAKRGERAAEAALVATGREIGRGLAAVVSTINPKRIYLAGEVITAWDLVEKPIREALREGTLTTATRETPIIPELSPGEYRLRGAVALVAAPRYAAPRVG
jgi:N-acetylglucosamine repressor